MALFVCERYAPATSARAVANEDERAASTSSIRHIRTWLLPADETCFSLFDAPSADAVKAAGAAVDVHYARITEAVETDGTAAS